MFFLKKIALRFLGRSRGSSLILVLSALALLMILILGFLASVGSEFQSSKMYANGSSLKLLAQSSVNLVIAQLRVATADATACWASQPGMIRTYDNAGQPKGYYKLYSADTMQGSNAFNSTLQAAEVPTNWFDKKGVYVDLNQPVTVDQVINNVTTKVNYFPILTGDANDLMTYNPPFDNTGSGAETVRAIKQDTASPTLLVSGFWLNKNTPVDSTSPNKAPMPVKWLYVLQDGKVAVPDSNSVGGTVSFTGAGSQPSSDNPIVGRMAFWTDDETAKVNINTASEGAFWDTPRSFTIQDRLLGQYQPVQGEYQRYPGHPATVSLSAVLGGLSNASTVWTPEIAFSQNDFYKLTPGTRPGGSQGGTFRTTNNSASPATTNGLAPAVRRLYSTVDEFMFQFNMAANVRLDNSALLTGNTDALKSSTLRKSRFFLTANSQAPDVNVFNLPRISMWPITLKDDDTPAQTAFDKLITYCTTVNQHVFYFQRKDPTSPTVDLPTDATSSTGLKRNRQLLEYLRNLTGKPIPGFGSGTFATKYGTPDRDQLLVEMFDYIRATNLQDTSALATPYAKTFGGTSTANRNYLGGKGQVVPIVDENINISDPSGGASNHPRGFGRFPTVQQAAIVFIGAGDDSPATVPSIATSIAPGFPAPNYYYLPVPVLTPPPAIKVQRVQAGFFLQMFDPSQGVAVTYPWYEVEVTGLESMNWSNSDTTSYPMRFPSTGVLGQPWNPDFRTSSQTHYGGMSDYRILAFKRGDPGGPTVAGSYPFITPPTGRVSAPTIPPSTQTPVDCPDMDNGMLYFKGGNATVKIYALDKNGSRISGAVQTVNLKFPPAKMPTPMTLPDSTKALNLAPATADKSKINLRSFYDYGGFPGRLNMDATIPWIGSSDAVRAVIASPGDMRLVAARATVPDTFYGTLGSDYSNSDYNKDTVRFSHNLRFGLIFPVYGGAGGRLVGNNTKYSNYQEYYKDWGSVGANDMSTFGASSGTYYRSKDTSVPFKDGITPSVPGGADWDSGFANSVDGPFINKADEGDSGSGSGDPYFELDYGNALPGATFFSPNRMIPSSGMFGSLPTGVWSNKPWQTLLFRPAPAGHAGLGSSSSPSTISSPPYSKPPDHLIMDLFTMPVVEPYSISTPLATSGRINLNYQIMPFTYIHRDTGLRAVLKAQMVTAIAPPGGGLLYKNYQNPSSGGFVNAQVVRYPINQDATIAQLQTRFDGGDIFRSASEICNVDIIPGNSPTPTNSLPAPSGVLPANARSKMDAYWGTASVTGDNVKERPYANIYPLLTTKSNTYTVHFRVQLLKQLPKSNMATWKEGTDQVLSQYRGSQTIERYIDPNDTIPDYATESYPSSRPLSDYYKFRIVSTQQFAP